MVCCLNPDCAQPINQDQSQFCRHCGVPLVSLLRNRFKILKPLGRGGFGKTYLAEDTEKLNEPCVVKQLAYRGAPNTDTIQKVRELFEREARQLQTLGEHSQIPSLLAYFEDQSSLFLVQQLISGQTLQAELDQQGPFDELKIRGVLADLLPILQFIHQNGVVHRDLKPENIIRSTLDQHLVLIDFGVSKVLSTSVQPNPGTLLGSQGYSPLEQLLEGKASPASDLFSLGATCFHLLTQITPHQLMGVAGYQWTQTWQQHLPHPLSPQLIAILDQLLQSDVTQRYQTCDQVLQDLNPSTPPPPTGHVASVPVTNDVTPSAPTFPVPAILGGIALILLVGVPMVWTLTHSPTPDPVVNTEPADGKALPDSKASSDDPNPSEDNRNSLQNLEIVQLPPPNFQRASTTPAADQSFGVQLLSAEPNLITDTTAWFQKHQVALPTYEVPNPVRNVIGNLPDGIEPKIGDRIIVKAIQGSSNLLLFYGPNYSGGTVLYGYDETEQTYLFGFDFSAYEFAPDNDPADLDFVDQKIQWAQQDGNILYVSHGHQTYARSSRGMNAYVTAIDLITKKALWTSQPLVSNASNFLVLEEMIITGYGFTAEPDFLYFLDKASGQVLKEVPLDTSPEYIFRKGDRLLVRGYNTDYEFTRLKRKRPR